jgi:endonuclease/exonuclease/phosphatase family metal-dependent hydrolase
LQEAVRVGGSVPAAPGSDAVSARAIGAETDPARSVEAVAARTGLFVFYAPSMRNGAELREDRGNAILSTLPLADPVVIELPYERQRRAAVTARIALPVADGESVPLRLVSAHFDNTSSGARFWRSFGEGRARQARGLLEVLPEDEWVVLGGDLNTWFGEAGEEAIALLSGRLAQPRTIPEMDTYSPPYGLPHRQADYLLASLPEGWQTGYQVAGDWRSSDHAPLVGWLEPPPRAAASGPATKEER